MLYMVFFIILSKSIDMKALSGTMSRMHERTNSFNSSHRTITFLDRDERSDSKRLTKLWHVPPLFSRFRVDMLVRYTLP